MPYYALALDLQPVLFLEGHQITFIEFFVDSYGIYFSHVRCSEFCCAVGDGVASHSNAATSAATVHRWSSNPIVDCVCYSNFILLASATAGQTEQHCPSLLLEVQISNIEHQLRLRGGIENCHLTAAIPHVHIAWLYILQNCTRLLLPTPRQVTKKKYQETKRVRRGHGL